MVATSPLAASSACFSSTMRIDWSSRVRKYQRRFFRSATLVHSVTSAVGSPTAELITEPLGMSNWFRIWNAANTASSAVWLGTAALL